MGWYIVAALIIYFIVLLTIIWNSPLGEETKDGFKETRK